MKVPVTVITSDEERVRAPRPEGHSVSYSQLSTPCDKKLEFKRKRVKVSSPLGSSLLYGRAFHSGIEAYLRGSAKTPEVAVKAALAALEQEVATNTQKAGVRWDEPHTLNLNGTIALKDGNFGSLPSIEFCRYWLKLQVPLWISVYGKTKLLASEHRIFVPLRPSPGQVWKNKWSVESWLDFVVEPTPGGWGITDTKTAAKPWDQRDIDKSSWQAHLYMGAMFRERKEEGPSAPFQFQILHRSKAAHDWMVENLDGLLAGKAFSVEEAEPALQVIEVPFSIEKINTYINGVVKPKVSTIEAGIFVASPVGWWCSERFCDYWSHCRFGSGKNL